MHFKTLVTLFLSATVVAAQTATEVEASSYEQHSAAPMALSVPNSIYSAIVTAVPSSWIYDMMNPASRSAEFSRIEAGTFPAWYSTLPENVKTYAASLAMAQLDALHVTPTATADSGSLGSDSNSKGPSATGAQTTPIPTAMTTSARSSTSTSTSGSKSTSSSNTKSSSSSHSASTGGAPAPTGSIAISVAGAACILGLALAL